MVLQGPNEAAAPPQGNISGLPVHPALSSPASAEARRENPEAQVSLQPLVDLGVPFAVKGLEGSNDHAQAG